MSFCEHSIAVDPCPKHCTFLMNSFGLHYISS